jgi:PAS domain S-box-containing protein
MLGPLHEVLEDEELNPKHREHLSTSYRNTLRLQKLVNTLLDFSRIEAGKMDVRFEELNLGKYTEDLASSFRSAIESGGIQYVVTIGALSRNVQVDPDMWENIVLNLISNAFKYTKKGRIEVEITEMADHVALKVTDTGVGIRTEDQARIFERFYRVNNADGRSQEGTGIGLSMVKELVALHDGEISLQSELRKGTAFCVTIPVVQRNLLPKHKREGDRLKDRTKFQFLAEALKWNGVATLNHSNENFPSTDAVKNNRSKGRVIVADDNSDMRAYVQRLLRDDFEVQTVTNGEEAFAMALSWEPDLILSDVMMPELDGYGLLKKLKATLVTRNIPLIFLSARAGEEARVEGITAGADDYLVKPFSAKELIARATNHILISKTRRQTEKEFYNLFLQSPAQILVMKGPDHVVEFFHPLAKKFVGGRDITGMKMREAVPEVEGQGYFEMLDQVYLEGKSFFLPETKASLIGDEGKTEEYYFNITYLPLKNTEGRIDGILQFTLDVTEQAKSTQKIKESEERFRILVTSIPQIIWIADTNSNIEYLSDQWESYTGISIAEGRAKFSSFIHPDDIGLVREKWFESIKMKKPWQCEYRLKDTRTNEYRWFFGHTLPLLDAAGEIARWIGSAADIHTQKTANEQLEELVSERTSELVELNKMLKGKNDELSSTQTFLRTVLDSSVELVTAFDKDLNVTFVNNRLKAFSLQTPEQLTGTNLLQTDPGFEKTQDYQHLMRALQGETVHLEARKPRNDNSLVFETFILPLKHKGQISGVVTMQRDITAIVNLTENLKISNEQLKRSNEDLQQFAHVTSHDLKEPVRKIKTYGDILKTNFSGYLPEKANDYLNKIEKATTRISSMIDGVLQYSTVGAVDHAFEVVDLNVIVSSIIEDLEIVIKESGATIKVETLPAINGLPTLIHQLFYNLINNSLKFRRPDQMPVISIQCDVASNEELVRLGVEGNFLRISLQDNGIGFEQIYADRIFDSFSRLNPKDKYEGTGLGLALCKKIALRHNGFIVAESSPNAGSTFSIFFPKRLLAD